MEKSSLFASSSCMKNTRSKYTLYFNQIQNMHTVYACTTSDYHLVVLQFSFQAVHVVENKFFVEIDVGIADKPPDCFPLCFKILPGAQSRLKIKKTKQKKSEEILIDKGVTACAT